MNMKRFRVRETVKVSGWTYVNADNIEEAEKKLNGDIDVSMSDDIMFESDGIYDDLVTHWETLEEVIEE